MAINLSLGKYHILLFPHPWLPIDLLQYMYIYVHILSNKTIYSKTSDCSRNKFGTHWSQRIGTIYELFFITVNLYIWASSQENLSSGFPTQ